MEFAAANTFVADIPSHGLKTDHEVKVMGETNHIHTHSNRSIWMLNIDL